MTREDVPATVAFDAVIAGNGVLGLSLGLELVRQGARVAVLGAPSRRWAATTASGAMLGCFGEATSALLGSAPGRLKLELGIRAVSLWDGWLEGLRESADSDSEGLVTASDTVVLLNSVGTGDVDDRNFASIHSALDQYAAPYDDIDPTDIAWLDPEPTARPLRAVRIHGERAVDSGLLLHLLEAAFVRAGGVLVPEPADRVEVRAGHAIGLVTESGELMRGADIVLAVGARTDALLRSAPGVADGIPPIVSGMGVSALVRLRDRSDPGVVLRTPNRAFACGLHLVPRGPGRVYLGATNIVTASAAERPTVRDAMFLLDCATRQLRRDLTVGGLERINVGNRPVSVDGFPLLGPTAIAGLHLMTGTYRDGLTLSPLLASEFARLLAGKPTETDLSPFTPVRRPIQPFSRYEIVDTAVTHMLATGYENDWHIPVEWGPIIESNQRMVFTRLADDIDAEFTPPPEILAASRAEPGLVTVLRRYYATCRALEGKPS